MQALVVDDSRSMRTIVSRILRGIGAEVTEAPDGRAAVEQLQRGPVPDVALVDWHMPVMNGIEFVTEARRRPEWRTMSIMMVTTESEPDQIVRALVAGAHEYLIKPFTAEALLEKLGILGLAPEADGGPGVSSANAPGGSSAP